LLSFSECRKDPVTHAGLHGLRDIFRIDAHEIFIEWVAANSLVSSITLFLASRPNAKQASHDLMNAWGSIQKVDLGPGAEKLVGTR
jgi:hypothetical protein